LFIDLLIPAAAVQSHSFGADACPVCWLETTAPRHANRPVRLRFSAGWETAFCAYYSYQQV
jgi:hypothetical protein